MAVAMEAMRTYRGGVAGWVELTSRTELVGERLMKKVANPTGPSPV